MDILKAADLQQAVPDRSGRKRQRYAVPYDEERRMAERIRRPLSDDDLFDKEKVKEIDEWTIDEVRLIDDRK